MKTFYQFLQTYRQPKLIDDITKFANDAFNDHTFPKQSKDYDEISSYLELNGHYLSSMSVFDEAWEKYTNNMIR
ncbi:YozE family protein [Bacillus testis]|uniref:YozE family protein n=1 Tax=Bacillus testis TaxID=1622072 RepID=UPI00067F26EC|nr:YozE family protein [Bacillus testis]